MPKANKLTDNQKARFAAMLVQTWTAIAPDAEKLVSRGRGRVGEIIELVCDANRPEDFGGMSKDDYRVLLGAYDHRDTQKWLRRVLNY